MNQCLRLVVFSLILFLQVQVINCRSDFRILDQNFNEIEDEELLQKLHNLENQLKRNLFYIPTDKVITDDQVNHVIHAVSLKSNIKLVDAVAAIVNVKLIKRLQFDSVAKYYASCMTSIDSRDAFQYLAVGNNISNSPIGVSALLDFDSPQVSDSVVSSDNRKLKNPCSSTDEGVHAASKCGSDACKFYYHCVLHHPSCTTDLLELPVAWLKTNPLSLPFTSDDRHVRKHLARAVVLAQYGNPHDAIAYVTEAIEDVGNHPGLLHARVLAYARTGLKDEILKPLLNDIELAHSVNSRNEETIFRKALVYLTVGQFEVVISTLEASMKLYPSNPIFHEIKASAHLQRQELAESEDHYRQALELGSTNSQAIMQKLGLALYRQGKLANAVGVYKELLNLTPNDSNILISIAHSYRQQADGRKALIYANRAVKLERSGKIQLLVRGLLYHGLGKDQDAITDLQNCLLYHPNHELCMYNSGIVFATLGQFYRAIRSLATITAGMDISSTNSSPNSHYIKSVHLTNYFRYIHARLSKPVLTLDVDGDFLPTCKDGWAKGTALEMDELLECEEPNLNPDIAPVYVSTWDNLDGPEKVVLCEALKYGKLMQVNADSFLPNQRFNIAMGFAALDIAQRLNRVWQTLKCKKSEQKKLVWKSLFKMALPYRRLADVETPILWLSDIFNSLNIGYHNEVSLYRSQVRNLRMKSYYDQVFERTKVQINWELAKNHGEHVNRMSDVSSSQSPEALISTVKPLIGMPAKISVSVPSHIKKGYYLEGSIIELGNVGYNSGAYLFLNIPTNSNKTSDYNKEMDSIFNQIAKDATKYKSKNMDKTADQMMALSYYFFNLCPLSRGSASVGYATLLGMLMSIEREITSPLPSGKMIDMEAALIGSPEDFILTLKEDLKIKRMEQPLDSLPLVAGVFPTVRSVLEALSVEELRCSEVGR